MLNKKLETRLTEIHRDTITSGRNYNEPVVSKSLISLESTSIQNGDLTSLRVTIDARFAKVENTVEKIHNEFKLKLFDYDTPKNKNFNNHLFSNTNGNNVYSNEKINTKNNFNEQIEINKKIEDFQRSLSLALEKDIRGDFEEKPLETEWKDVIIF